MTEQEAKMAQKVQLYDLRLIFTWVNTHTNTPLVLFYRLQIFPRQTHPLGPGGGGQPPPFSKSVEVTRWQIPPQRKPGERPTRQGS